MLRCVCTVRSAEKISNEVKGAESAKKWSAAAARGLLELVASQKGVTEDADVCLLREVKTKFQIPLTPVLQPYPHKTS